MSVSKLCEELVTAGSDVEVLTTTANGLTELPVTVGEQVIVDGVKVTYFNRLTKDHSHFSPKLLARLWKIVKEYDVVHIHAWWNTVSIFSVLITQLRGVPVIVSPRGTLSAYSFNNRKSALKKLFHSLVGRNLLNKSYIHVTSVAEQEIIMSIIAPRKIFNIGNIVDFPVITVDPEPANQSVFKLIFLSRIDEKKGLNILLNALPLIGHPFHLTIAGTGNEDYVQALKDILLDNLIPKVSWVGFQHEKKFELLRTHDLLVLPSHNENFGNVVIESLSMGTAVLVSKQVGLAGYVTERHLGWECDTDPASVAAAVNDIIACQKKELLRIRETAALTLAADFEKRKMVNQYVAMYNNMICHE